MVCDACETIRFPSHAILGSTHGNTRGFNIGKAGGAVVVAFANIRSG